MKAIRNNMINYTDKQIEFIKRNIQSFNFDKLTKLFNIEFNLNKSKHQIYYMACSLDVKRATFCYTEEHIDFLKTNVKGVRFSMLTDMFNQHFNLNKTSSEISSRCKFLKISNNRVTRFVKGHIPFTAGTKGYMKVNSGSFKKGHLNKSTRPVGSERICVTGYVQVKIAEPKTWKQKHMLVYEKHHGQIPKGSAIIFLNGDRADCRIDNLFLVTRRELVYINKNKLNYENPDIKKSAVILTKLIVAMQSKVNKKLVSL